LTGNAFVYPKGITTQKKIYNESPLEVAKAFEAHGIAYLHLVDLDGAKSKHIVNYKVLERLANKTSLKIDFGGGLKSDADINIAFESGASQITGGSIAVKSPETFMRWLDQYGSEKIILGADVKGTHIAIEGWLKTSEQTLFDFVHDYKKKGVEYVICTDISKDGMLEGPAFDLYKSLLAKEEIKLIASGGISKFEELPQLQDLGCEGVIIGKAIYENRISLKQLENYVINSDN